MNVDINSINDETFVSWWLKAYKDDIGLLGMVKEHNLFYAAASTRASKLRRAGVKLPTMKKRGTANPGLEVDVEKLNGMVVKELGEGALNWRTR